METFGKIVNYVFGGISKVLETAANSLNMIIETLSGLSIGQILKVSYGLYALGASLAAFGVMVAVGLPGILLFTAALGVMGSVLIKTIPSINSVFNTLSEVDGKKLIEISSGLFAISTGLTSLMIAGIGSSLFGSGSLKKLEQLAKIANPLNIASNAMELLADNVDRLSQALLDLNIDTLKEIQKVGSGLDYKLSSYIGNILIPKVEQIGNVTTQIDKHASLSVKEKSHERLQTVKETDNNNSEVLIGNSQPDSQNNKIIYELREMKKIIGETLNRPVIVQIGDMELKSLSKAINAQNNYI